MTEKKNEKINDLNVMLMGVENELLKRKVDRQDVTIDSALDTLNKAAENGDIELTDCCDDDEDTGEEIGNEDGGSEEETETDDEE